MKISVIIPTHNRADALEKTLEKLAVQDFKEEWEAIVINNNSVDNTDELVRNYRFPVSLKLIHEKTPGPSAARNAGAKAAKGEFLVFIDNDILVSPDFVRKHVETLQAHPKTWFVGRVINPPDLRDTAFGRYRDDLHESYFQDLPPEGFTDYDGATGQNWAMRRSEFFDAGTFDESYSIASCEDKELAQRAIKKGFRNVFNPYSIVIHNDWAIDLDAFCKRQEMYSVSTVLLWQKYGEDSFQLEIVEENAPVNLKKDSAKVISKKIFKKAFSTSVGYSLAKSLTRFIERLAPDTKLSYKAYKTVVALGMFRGVREGFKRYTSKT